MKEELVTYKTAVLAKEKGFKSIEVAAYYNTCNEKGNPGITLITDDGIDDWNALEEGKYGYFTSKEEKLYSAPTQSLLQKWLREKHDLHIQIAHSWKIQKQFWSNGVTNLKTLQFLQGHYLLYKTYEEALEAGLQQTLKIIKS